MTNTGSRMRRLKCCFSTQSIRVIARARCPMCCLRDGKPDALLAIARSTEDSWERMLPRATCRKCHAALAGADKRTSDGHFAPLARDLLRVLLNEAIEYHARALPPVVCYLTLLHAADGLDRQKSRLLPPQRMCGGLLNLSAGGICSRSTTTATNGSLGVSLTQ